MKQQERLEEREQDIEDQLYKLESDKRLVEVGDPEHRSGDGDAGSWVSSLLGVLSCSMPEPSVNHSPLRLG